MSQPADNAVSAQRFNEAARAFTRPSLMRHAKLMPMKEGILELRQKGASLELIRQLLATVDVIVGRDTIARFLKDVSGDGRAPSRNRPKRHRAAVTTATQASPPLPATTPAPHVETPAERPRARGPRVADPRNL